MDGVVALVLTIVAAAARQTPPSHDAELIAEPVRALRDSLGGGARSFRIDSAILEQKREIDIVLPASFADTTAPRRYPVVIVLDGAENIATCAAVSDELARNGQIPELILVAIENIDPLDGRVHDLTPPGLSVSGSSANEGGDKFLDFIEQELLPAVDRQFRGGLPRVIVGHSSGGILATYAAATRSAYRMVVAIDTPIHLGENWLAKKLTTRAAAAEATPLRYFSYSVKFPWPQDAWNKLVAAAPATWKLHNEQLAHEGHETVVMLATYLGLRDAFNDYSRLAAPQTPTTSVLPYYTTVAASFGAPLVPPRRVLRDLVGDLLMEGRGAAAREAYAALAFGYGPPSDNAQLLAEIADAEKLPPPLETVEALLAMPFPTPDEARAFIGEWIGDLWMNPDEPRTGKLSLRIRVVDGQVVGESVHHETPNGDVAQPWRHMRITSTGLNFGFMNGMRPRGVALFEATLDGDTLTGTQRIAGVAAKMPDGSPPPRLSFKFVRVKK